MSLEPHRRSEDAEVGEEVHHPRLAMLSPAAILQSLVEKSNEFISEHRLWLAGFPPTHIEQSSFSSSSYLSKTTSIDTAYALITAPPSLELRDASPQPPLLNCASQFCDCTPQVTAAAASVGSVLSASIVGLSSSFNLQLSDATVALNAANNQLALFTSSLGFLNGGNAAAASSASAAASSANATIAAIQSSASSVVAAAQESVSSANSAAQIAQSSASSASSLVAIAQASASSANVAAAVAQASASQILSIANSIASDAQATATLALAQALSTISAVNVQASASIVSARIEAMSATKFALIVTFSILGSSVVSILAFYLILRYRKARMIAREHRQHEQYTDDYYSKSMSDRSRSRRSSYDNYSRSGSRSRKSIGNRTDRSQSRPRKSTGSRSDREWDDKQFEDSALDVPLPIREKTKEDYKVSDRPSTPPPLERTNTLIYDPASPDKPPRFRSWLTQSVRSVSPFGDMIRNSKEIKAAKKKEEDDEIRKMAIRKAREGEERKEAERKKRESDERRLRARVENEEVVRKVSLRRVRQVEDTRQTSGTAKDAGGKNSTVDDDDDDDYSDNVSDIGTAK